MIRASGCVIAPPFLKDIIAQPHTAVPPVLHMMLLREVCYTSFNNRGVIDIYTGVIDIYTTIKASN